MNRRSIEAGRGHVTIGIRNRIAQGSKAVARDLDHMGRRMVNFGKMAAGIGLATATPLAFAAKKFADFDDAMRSVGAISRASEKDLAMLTDRAKELGRTTSFTAVDVANLMTELGRAGFNPEQIENMTGAVLNLARATGTEAPLAASTMAAAIRQFGMEASEAGRVSDALTAAANNSFNSIETLSESLTYAGPVANDFNMSIEETLAILGSLGNVGIQGSNAGTAVRRLLTLTGAEAKKLKGIFGVEFTDAAGNARPLIDTLDEVAKATNNLGTAERSAKFNEAFGLLGITGASAISKSAAETRDLLNTIKEAGGVAEETATKMDAGLGGSFRKLLSAAEGVQIAVGEAFGDELSSVIDGVSSGLGYVTNFVEKNQQLVAMIAAGSAGLLAFGAGMIAAGVAATAVSVAITGIGTVLGAVGAAVGLVISPIGLTVAAVGGLAYAFLDLSAIGAKALDWLKNQFGPLVDTATEAMAGITAALKSGDMEAAWQIATDALGIIWHDLTDGIRDAWTDTTAFVLNVSAGLAGQVGKIFQSLAGFLGDLLDGYKSYYDKIYNAVVEAGGNLNGVRTIGAPSGSAFEASFGDSEKAFRAKLAGLSEFGALMEQEANSQMENRLNDAQKTKDERKKAQQDRRDSLTTNTGKAKAKQAIESVPDLDLRSLFAGFGKPRGDLAAEIGGGGGGGSAGAVAGATAGATFSAFGAMLSGLGPITAQERTAAASEKQVELLGEIRESLAGEFFGSAIGAAESLINDPLGSLKGAAESGFGFALNAADGMAGAIAGQLATDSKMAAAVEPAKPGASGGGSDKILETIAEATKATSEYLKRGVVGRFTG